MMIHAAPIKARTAITKTRIGACTANQAPSPDRMSSNAEIPAFPAPPCARPAAAHVSEPMWPLGRFPYPPIQRNGRLCPASEGETCPSSAKAQILNERQSGHATGAVRACDKGSGPMP